MKIPRSHRKINHVTNTSAAHYSHLILTSILASISQTSHTSVKPEVPNRFLVSVPLTDP